MTDSDLKAVFDIRLAVTENTVTMEYLKLVGITPSTISAALNGRANGWVCTDKNIVVGFVIGDSTTGEVTVLATQPGYEGRGIGKQLMQLVQTWLFKQGHDELWLVTEPNSGFRAYGFYQSLGWQPTGEIIGEDEKLVLRRH